MKNRKQQPKVDKEHDSDPESDKEIEEEQNQVAEVSREEEQARQLENVPVIPDSEVSPAAYIFQHTEEHDDLNIYEEK